KGEGKGEAGPPRRSPTQARGAEPAPPPLILVSDYEETRATARLPNLDIEVVHRRPYDGGAEMLAIPGRAAPAFEAGGRVAEAANPWLFWMRVMEAAWSPWLGSAAAARRRIAGKP